MRSRCAVPTFLTTSEEVGGTRLTQRETVRTRGLLRVLEPLIGRMLSRQLEKRLEGIKAVLESGWVVVEPQ